jgi:uncharacterized repeat protein (TIGR01451 family)
VALDAAGNLYIADGADHRVRKVSEPINVPPAAQFSADSASGCAPLQVSFTEASVEGDGTIEKWYWDFGDGGHSTNRHPVHNYTTSGEWTVTLTVTDTTGCSDTETKTHYITANSPPTAGFAADATSGCTPLQVSFTDASLEGDGTINEWFWDYGDGGPVGLTQNPTHVYPFVGTYSVTLTVTDSLGCSDSETKPSLIQALDCGDFGSVGDFVWHDLDDDGIQDAGEAGIDGVGVRLWHAGFDGAIAGGDDVLMDTQTTGGASSHGSFLFTNVVPGRHYLQFVLPDGYFFSPQNQGGDDTQDSDVDPGTGLSAVFDLLPDTLASDWDAGLGSDVDAEKSRAHGTGRARASRSLWYYVDITNTTSSALNNVVVTDMLPGEPIVRSVRVSEGGIFDGVNTVTWNLGALEPGFSAQLWVRFTLSAQPTGATLVNRAVVKADELGVPLPVIHETLLPGPSPRP